MDQYAFYGLYTVTMWLHSFCVILGDVATSNNGGSNSNVITIVGGVIGGFILLLMITVVLCIVILCMRNSENNPSCDITKANTVDSLFITGGLDVPITANPSYAVLTKSYVKTSEDEYNYVQPNKFNQHSDLDGSIKMDTNPSYESGEDRATAFSTTSDTKAHHSSHDATTKQYDHDDRLLHQNTAASTTGDANIHAAVDQSRNTYLSLIPNSAKLCGQGEYGVVNQPKSNDPNYNTTGDTKVQIHTAVDSRCNVSLAANKHDKSNGEDEYGVINQPKSDDPDL